MACNPQHIILLHHFRRFLEKAHEAGIDAAPLKGAHLVSGVYPADVDRGMMADVDFLVRPEHFAGARRILEELGFYREAKPPSHPTHEESLYLDITADRRIMFEVHEYLFHPARFPIDHEAIWRRSTASDFDGAPCRRLAPEDNYAHIAFHATVHRLMSLKRALADLEFMLRRGNVDPELVVERAREWRVTRAVWLLTRLLDADCPDLELAAMIGELAPPPPVGAALDFLVPRGGDRTRLSRLHHRAQAALLWPLVFDSPLQLARLVVNHPCVRYHLRKAT